MKKIKEYRVRISEDSYNFLNNLYKQTKIPKSKLLDIFINDIEKCNESRVKYCS
ncbi:MAG: ribbon-helix-helix domain-containing protein [Sulfurovaceae bacterium]|nr:ribbon-helix-helix domain-containing protein [Sulfurovaceae bacterium]